MITSALLALALTASETKTFKTSDGSASLRLVFVPVSKTGYTRVILPKRPSSSHTYWRGTRVWGVEWSHKDTRTGKWLPLEVPHSHFHRISVFELRSRGRVIKVPVKLYRGLFDVRASSVKLSRSRSKILISMEGSDGGAGYDSEFIITPSTIERRTGVEMIEETIVVKQRNRL